MKQSTPDDLVAVREQALGEVRADEAGGAGDDDLHRSPAASIRARTAASGSPPAKAAAPTTTMSAPASTTVADVAGVDAAVHLDARGKPARPDPLPEPPDLVEVAGQELLAREAGVHGHHEHEVEPRAGSPRARAIGVDRVEGDAGRDAALAQVGDRALQVGERLDVDADRGGAGVDEGVEVALGVLDHQVRRRSAGAVARRQASTTTGPEADVRHEAAVHHVDVDEPGAAALDGRDLVGEVAEVGRRGSRERGSRGRLADVEAERRARADAVAGGRALPQHDARRDPGVGAVADVGDLEPGALAARRAPRRASRPIRSGIT